jgi:hypothetical protein
MYTSKVSRHNHQNTIQILSNINSAKPIIRISSHSTNQNLKQVCQAPTCCCFTIVIVVYFYVNIYAKRYKLHMPWCITPSTVHRHALITGCAARAIRLSVIKYDSTPATWAKKKPAIRCLVETPGKHVLVTDG